MSGMLLLTSHGFTSFDFGVESLCNHEMSVVVIGISIYELLSRVQFWRFRIKIIVDLCPSWKYIKFYLIVLVSWENSKPVCVAQFHVSISEKLRSPPPPTEIVKMWFFGLRSKSWKVEVTYPSPPPPAASQKMWFSDLRGKVKKLRSPLVTSTCDILTFWTFSHWRVNFEWHLPMSFNWLIESYLFLCVF